jgi:hypothetical protein
MSPSPGHRRDVPRLAGIAELWPLSIEQYHRMIETGIIADGSAIELIEGFLVGKDRGRGHGKPHRPRHAAVTRQITRLLRLALGQEWLVQSQLPVVLGPTNVPGAGSELQPDVAVAAGKPHLYAAHHPLAADLRLVVEVADSSSTFDHTVKQPLYAAAGIGFYWIVNILDQMVEVFSDPDTITGQYRDHEVLAEDQPVELRWHGLEPYTFHVQDFLSVRE